MADCPAVAGDVPADIPKFAPAASPPSNFADIPAPADDAPPIVAVGNALDPPPVADGDGGVKAVPPTVSLSPIPSPPLPTEGCAGCDGCAG